MTLTLDMRALAFFDVTRNSWVAEAGLFNLLAGFSSAEIVSGAAFSLQDNWIDDSACLVKPIEQAAKHR